VGWARVRLCTWTQREESIDLLGGLASAVVCLDLDTQRNSDSGERPFATQRFGSYGRVRRAACNCEERPSRQSVMVRIPADLQARLELKGLGCGPRQSDGGSGGRWAGYEYRAPGPPVFVSGEPPNGVRVEVIAPPFLSILAVTIKSMPPSRQWSREVKSVPPSGSINSCFRSSSCQFSLSLLGFAAREAVRSH